MIADKSSGKFTEFKVIGVATSEEDIAYLVIRGKDWIAHYDGQQIIDFERTDEHGKENEVSITNGVLSKIIQTSLRSPQTIINKVYDRIGFNAIKDEELRHLVVSRICSQMSKKATVEYLRRHFKNDVSLQKIYRYLDKLYNIQRELVQEISINHTRELFGGNLGMLFYDVKTLYFETTDKDELHESGFSKDGKNANPQVVLGLLVNRGGYPLSYSLFNGSQYEGYTMIPIVDDFVQRFNLGKDFVIIADAGLMSTKNVELLRKGDYKYIIGARIKKESSVLREAIISTEHKNGTFKDILCSDGDRMIVGYSDERAKKILEVRPMFHFNTRRIEAHVCICFVALKVYKELERLLKASHCPYSVDSILKTAETIVTLEIARPENNDTITRTLCITPEERSIAYLIDTDDWLNF